MYVCIWLSIFIFENNEKRWLFNGWRQIWSECLRFFVRAVCVKGSSFAVRNMISSVFIRDFLYDFMKWNYHTLDNIPLDAYAPWVVISERIRKSSQFRLSRLAGARRPHIDASEVRRCSYPLGGLVGAHETSWTPAAAGAGAGAAGAATGAGATTERSGGFVSLSVTISGRGFIELNCSQLLDCITFGSEIIMIRT